MLPGERNLVSKAVKSQTKTYMMKTHRIHIIREITVTPQGHLRGRASYFFQKREDVNDLNVIFSKT